MFSINNNLCFYFFKENLKECWDNSNGVEGGMDSVSGGSFAGDEETPRTMSSAASNVDGDVAITPVKSISLNSSPSMRASGARSDESSYGLSSYIRSSRSGRAGVTSVLTPVSRSRRRAAKKKNSDQLNDSVAEAGIRIGIVAGVNKLASNSLSLSSGVCTSTSGSTSTFTTPHRGVEGAATGMIPVDDGPPRKVPPKRKPPTPAQLIQRQLKRQLHRQQQQQLKQQQLGNNCLVSLPSHQQLPATSGTPSGSQHYVINGGTAGSFRTAPRQTAQASGARHVGVTSIRAVSGSVGVASGSMQIGAQPIFRIPTPTGNCFQYFTMNSLPELLNNPSFAAALASQVDVSRGSTTSRVATPQSLMVVRPTGTTSTSCSSTSSFLPSTSNDAPPRYVVLPSGGLPFRTPTNVMPATPQQNERLQYVSQQQCVINPRPSTVLLNVKQSSHAQVLGHTGGRQVTPFKQVTYFLCYIYVSI